MDVVQCVKRLEGCGFAFSLDSDGKVRISQPPERNPIADNLMSWLRANKADLVDLLAARKPKQLEMNLVGVGYDKARQVADLIDDGKAVLVDKVRYHARTDKYDIRYREVEP